MPRAARTSKKAQRAAPYSTRSVSAATRPSDNMAVAVAAPYATGWEHHVYPQHYHHLDAQQQDQYNHYQQQVMPSHYSAMPTPVSGALPVQAVSTPLMPHPSIQSGPTQESNCPWTAQMDEVLIENHKRLKWDQIAERFFGNTKSGNACRKRYARVVQERKDPSRWEQDKVQKVIQAYNKLKMREKIWKPLADEVGESWEDIERLCYSQGLKQMTGKTVMYGHKKRQSAASHRSQTSIHSDNGQPSNYEDDDEDDSGLADVHQHPHGRTQLLPMSGPDYATREHFQPYDESFYRDYGRGPQ